MWGHGCLAHQTLSKNVMTWPGSTNHHGAARCISYPQLNTEDYNDDKAMMWHYDRCISYPQLNTEYYNSL